MSKKRSATATVTEPNVINRDTPAETARLFRKQMYPTIIKHNRDWLAYDGSAYQMIEDDTIESEILHLHFWDTAFEKLKAADAIVLATSGKMAGCWIMPAKEKTSTAIEDPGAKESAGPTAAQESENNQDKIIVRSNGTVTYVGKDIAYQLWKFGLLGKDFFYARWPGVPDLWTTSESLM